MLSMSRWWRWNPVGRLKLWISLGFNFICNLTAGLLTLLILSLAWKRFAYYPLRRMFNWIDICLICLNAGGCYSLIFKIWSSRTCNFLARTYWFITFLLNFRRLRYFSSTSCTDRWRTLFYIDYILWILLLFSWVWRFFYKTSWSNSLRGDASRK